MSVPRFPMLGLTALLLLPLVSSVLPADEPAEVSDRAEATAPGLDREEAVVLAVRNSPEIQAALQRLGRAEGNRWTTRSRALPRLSASGSLEHRSEGLIDRAPPTDAQENAIDRALEAGQDPPPTSEVPITQDSYNTRLQLDQSLFAGFENYYGWRSANRRVSAERLLALDTALGVVRSVHSHFDQVLLSGQVVRIREDEVARAEELLAITRRRFESGSVREFEVLTARSRLARTKVDRSSARVARRQAVVRLRLAIGLDSSPGADGLLLEGDLVEKSFGAAEEIAPGTANLRSNPRWQGLDLLEEAADFNLSATELKIVPRVDAFANIQNNSSYYDFEDNLSGWAVGLTFQWNIFDGMRQRGERRVALADRREAAENRRAFAMDWEARFAEVLERLRDSGEILAGERESVALMEESRQRVFRLYQLGKVDQERVLRAENELSAARIRMLESIYRHNDAVYELRYLAGDQMREVAALLADMEDSL